MNKKNKISLTILIIFTISILVSQTNQIYSKNNTIIDQYIKITSLKQEVKTKTKTIITLTQINKALQDENNNTINFCYQTYDENEILMGENARIKTKLSQFEMYYNEKYNAEFDHHNGVLGLAFGDYISVWTRGRDIMAVLETCTHEYAHNEFGLEDPEET